MNLVRQKSGEDYFDMTIEYGKHNEEEFIKRILLYSSMLNEYSTEKLLGNMFENYSESEIVKCQNYFEKSFIYEIDNTEIFTLLTTIYKREKCNYTEDEKNVLIKLAKTTNDILEKESELEIKLYDTLKAAEKKHPIAAKIIAILLSGIVASVIDGSVQGALTNYLQNQSIEVEDNYNKDPNHTSIYIKNGDISDSVSDE